MQEKAEGRLLQSDMMHILPLVFIEQLIDFNKNIKHIENERSIWEKTCITGRLPPPFDSPDGKIATYYRLHR